MRKVIVSMNMTLDGFISGPDGELDWHFESWDDDMCASVTRQLKEADTLLFGRVTYKAMAGYWSSEGVNQYSSRKDTAFAEMLNSHTKIVFSRTLTSPLWANSRLVKGNIAATIARLKQQPGKDILVYGSCRLVISLVNLHLIDEYRIWRHPVIIGKGVPLFNNARENFNLELIKTTLFRSGVVLLYYAPKTKKNRQF